MRTEGKYRFSCVPSVAGRDIEGIRKSHLINTWLRGWCCFRNLGFFLIIGQFTQHLAANKVHLGQWRKGILA